jgi:imidazolonepropionase
MAGWELLLTDARIASMRLAPYGIVEKAALAIADGRIACSGRKGSAKNQRKETRSVNGQWLTPALIDCHTHLAFADNRAAEFAKRLAGASYEEIARGQASCPRYAQPCRVRCRLARANLPRLMALKARASRRSNQIRHGRTLTTSCACCDWRACRRAASVSVSTTFLARTRCRPISRPDR